ncbi:MAG: hypothetical protein QXX03_05510 [Nitrososphaerota archaeon]
MYNYELKKNEDGQFICPWCGEVIKNLQYVETGDGLFKIYMNGDVIKTEFQDFIENGDEKLIVHPECGGVICDYSSKTIQLIKEMLRSIEKIEEEL